jgi:hypothetical protein
MGALVVVAALILPIAFHHFTRSRLSNRVTDRLTQEVGEDAVVLVYVGALFAAVFALLGAARLSGAGVGAVLAFALSSLAVGVLSVLDGENVDVGD